MGIMNKPLKDIKDGNDSNVMFKKAIGRPRAYKTPEEMWKVAEEYFTGCLEHDEPITVTGTCLALGFSNRHTLIEYNKRDEYTHTVKRIKTVCESYAEKRAFSRSGNAAGPIFCLKNFGWTDTQTVNLNKTVELPDPGRSKLKDSDIDKLIAKAQQASIAKQAEKDKQATVQ